MTASIRTSPRIDKYKVLIVDDHPIVRQGLARLIGQEPDLDVREGPDNVAEAVEQVQSLQPHLVVVDISLREGNGIELISRIKKLDPQIKTLVWSMFDEQVFAECAIRAGAMGYVHKQEPVENVLAAIRHVLAGNMYLSPQMTNRVLRRLSTGETLPPDPVGGLSNREIEVFEMIGRGMTTKQIARRLTLSPKTIEAHREKIKAKLDLKNAAELNCRAVQWVLENG